MGLFSMFKKKKKDEFGGAGADPFAGGADSFASTPGSDPFAGQDPFAAKEPFPGPEADFSKASTQAGLSPEPTRRPLGMINEPQPVPSAPQPAPPDTSKDIEVISSKLDALKSQIESISIKVDHVETLIKNQAEAAKQRW